MDTGVRLNSARRVHQEVCCILLSALESLQSNLSELGTVVMGRTASTAAAADSPRGAHLSGAITDCKKRLSGISDTAKVGSHLDF